MTPESYLKAKPASEPSAPKSWPMIAIFVALSITAGITSYLHYYGKQAEPTIGKGNVDG
jgi:hypothetical protein